MRLSANGVFVHLDYMLVAVTKLKKEVLIYSCFERSEISVRGYMANVGMVETDLYQDVGDGTSKVIRFPQVNTVNHYMKLMNGRDPISHGVCISKKVNNQYIVTTKADCEQDLYNMLMTNFTLPLMREWMPYLLEAGAEHLVKSEAQIFGRVTPELEEAVIYENLIDETILMELVSEGLRSKKIFILEQTQNPLKFENMDDYFQKYGHSLVENLEQKLEPLIPLKDKVDEIAFLKKRFYPQQAAIVNGLMECMLHRKNAIVNEDMGCGKTLQGMGVIEGFFNAWFLRQHKDKTIKDVYLDKESVKYRNIIMCPSHLVEKWAESIREDIPYATTTIVRSLRELIQLRKRGKNRTGKEFYILSKDTGKLSYTYTPIPTQTKIKPVRQMICKDCNTIRRDYSVKECVCKSKQWKVDTVGFSKKGLVCPDCGELLFPADIRDLKFMEDGGTEPLQTQDFAVQTGANKNCRFCGAALWQPSCEPLESKYFFRRKPKKTQKWVKMTHWANKAKKNKRTVWVFKKQIDEYIADNELNPSEITYPRIHGPRKFAPSRYISKYLRGYFDFAIFDEAHECESSELLDTTNAEMR